MQYKIAICDDDKIFLQNISAKIARICRRQKVFFKLFLCINGDELIKRYELLERFDLVILDISMPGKNGKQIAERLRKFDNTFDLIFISSMTEEVFNTFSYGISSFIPKTQLDIHFEAEFVRVMKLHESKVKNTFLFKNCDTGNYVRYKISQIAYVESENRTVKVHIHDTVEMQISISVKSFERLKTEMQKYGFVEIHRTCIVNVSYIYCVNDSNVNLITDAILPLSRRKKSAVLENVSAYVSKVVV